MTGSSLPRPSAAIPRTVWALGMVSLAMDVSSEMIHALLPLFLTGVLGASLAVVGVIDGIAEATAAIAKVFSGYVSDRIGKRRPLILLGYGLGAVSKPLFALAGAPGPVLGARFLDRIGKGLRGAPRDALVADVTPPDLRGRAYGLRQSLDTVGAFLGPLLAVGLMALWANDMRAVFWVAAIPAAISVGIALIWVRDAAPPDRCDKAAAPIRTADLRNLSPAFWAVTGVGVIFTMARFSEAFLVLRADELGLPLALAPLVLVAMNVVYAAGAYPAGALADGIGTNRLLLGGVACLVAADLLLAFASGLAACFAGILLWGLHMALTQGLLAQLVAEHSRADLRGSAFGLFNLATGLTLLAASVLAGVLWDRGGADLTFLTGAGFALAAVLAIAALPLLFRARA